MAITIYQLQRFTATQIENLRPDIRRDLEQHVRETTGMRWPAPDLINRGFNETVQLETQLPQYIYNPTTRTLRPTTIWERGNKANSKKEAYLAQRAQWILNNRNACNTPGLTNTPGMRLKKSKLSIEVPLLNAIAKSTALKTRTTEYDPIVRQVYLMGKIVADIDYDNRVSAIRISGDSKYLIKLSRLRLNQLNVKCKAYKGKNRLTYLDGSSVFVPNDVLFSIPNHQRRNIIPSGLIEKIVPVRVPIQREILIEGLGLPYLPKDITILELPVKLSYSDSTEIMSIVARIIYKDEELRTIGGFDTVSFKGEDEISLICEKLCEELKNELRKKQREEVHNGWNVPTGVGKWFTTSGAAASTFTVAPNNIVNWNTII